MRGGDAGMDEVLEHTAVHDVARFVRRNFGGQNKEADLVLGTFESGILDAHLGDRIVQNAFTIGHGLEAGGHYAQHTLARHLEVDGEIEIDPEVRLGLHVVGDDGVAHFAVGHDNHVVARGAQAGGAPVDFDDLGDDVGLHAVLMNHQPIADLERSLNMNGQAHEEIEDHCAQGKANDHTEHAGGSQHACDVALKNGGDDRQHGNAEEHHRREVTRQARHRPVREPADKAVPKQHAKQPVYQKRRAQPHANLHAVLDEIAREEVGVFQKPVDQLLAIEQRQEKHRKHRCGQPNPCKYAHSLSSQRKRGRYADRVMWVFLLKNRPFVRKKRRKSNRFQREKRVILPFFTTNEPTNGL